MKILSDILFKGGVLAQKEVAVDSMVIDNSVSSVVVYDPVDKRLKIRSASTIGGQQSQNVTASNLGSGFGIFAQKSGDVIQLKSFVAGSGVSLQSDANTITITNTGALSVNGKTGVVVLSTTDIAEGANLYFTNARSRSAISATGVLQYNSSTGVLSIGQSGEAASGFLSSTDWQSFNNRVPSIRLVNTVNSIQGGGSLSSDRVLSLVGDIATPAANSYYGTNASGTRGWFALPVFEGGNSVLSVNGFTGVVVLNSSHIAENTNLYFTNSRARSAISVSGSLSYNPTTGVISYSTPNSDGINEGTTNLYFTNSRSRSSLSAGVGISYNSSTGVITNSQPDQAVVLTAGTNVQVTGTYPNFTITVPTVGEVNTGSNLGSTGASVFKQKSGLNLEFRKLIAGSNVSITEGSDGITIAASGGGGGGGEIATMSNIGTIGAGVFKQKTLSNFEMRRLVAGVNMVVTENTDNVTLEANVAPQVVLLSGNLYS